MRDVFCGFFLGEQRICRWFDTVFLYSLLPNLCLWQAQAGAAAATLLVRHEPQLLSPFSFTLFQILRQLLVCEICYLF